MIHLQELTHENHSLENQTSLLMLYDSSTRTDSWESFARESDITAHAVWFIYKNWLMRIIRSRIRHHCPCCMIHLQELTHENHSLENQTSLPMLYDSSTRTDSWESFARESDITAHAVWFIYKNWLMRIIRLENQTSLPMLYDSSTRTDSWESFARESDITAHAVWFIYKNWLIRVIGLRTRLHWSLVMFYVLRWTVLLKHFFSSVPYSFLAPSSLVPDSTYEKCQKNQTSWLQYSYKIEFVLLIKLV